VAGNDALPVDSFLVSFEQFHTQQEIFDLLAGAFAPGSGVSLHQVDKLTDRTYRISIHVAPKDRLAGEQLTKNILSKALVDVPKDVVIDAAPVNVATETVKGTVSDLGSILTTAASNVGQAAGKLAGGALGTSLGSVVIVLGIAALVIGAVVLSKRSA